VPLASIELHRPSLDDVFLATHRPFPARWSRSHDLVRDTWLSSPASAPRLRNPVWLIVGIFQPLCFLLLFGPLLNGMPQLGGGDAYQSSCPACWSSSRCSARCSSGSR
jgi:hypothetical protein